MYPLLMLSGENNSPTPPFRQNQQGLEVINISLNSQVNDL